MYLEETFEKPPAKGWKVRLVVQLMQKPMHDRKLLPKDEWDQEWAVRCTSEKKKKSVVDGAEEKSGATLMTVERVLRAVPPPPPPVDCLLDLIVVSPGGLCFEYPGKSLRHWLDKHVYDFETGVKIAQKRTQMLLNNDKELPEEVRVEASAWLHKRVRGVILPNEEQIIKDALKPFLLERLKKKESIARSIKARTEVMIAKAEAAAEAARASYVQSQMLTFTADDNGKDWPPDAGEKARDQAFDSAPTADTVVNKMTTQAAAVIETDTVAEDGDPVSGSPDVQNVDVADANEQAVKTLATIGD